MCDWPDICPVEVVLLYGQMISGHWQSLQRLAESRCKELEPTCIMQQLSRPSDSFRKASLVTQESPNIPHGRRFQLRTLNGKHRLQTNCTLGWGHLVGLAGR